MVIRSSGQLLVVALVTAASWGCASGGDASVAVGIAPSSATVPADGSVWFSANVTGGANTAVTWSVAETGCGSVTQTGLYTAPSISGTCRVQVHSDVDPTASATAVVTVTPASPGGGICGAATDQLFPPGAPWNTPVDSAPLDAESGTIIGYLAQNHTASARFQITFDFNTLYADATTPRRSFTPTVDFFDPDCDPAPVPVPAGGRLESESNYACTSDGDCHLTVIDASTCRLYEMWRANIVDGTSTGSFYGGCLAVWNLADIPPPTGRGDYCTSADAGGLPILPLMFNADEVAAGEINHALRFILPNALIRRLIYVRPATHSTTATGGSASAPPYGARLRLKASKDISALSAGAQVVARALKKYGMFLADGGNITFTAATDDLTTSKWVDVGVTSGSMKSLSWNDFEVVALGERFDWSTGSCDRTPITD